MGFVNIDLSQVTEHAVECFGLTDWQKQKVGAIVLIFDLSSFPAVGRLRVEKPAVKTLGDSVLSKLSTRGCEGCGDTLDVEELTKDSENDDVDEGAVKKNVVPQFTAFRMASKPHESFQAHQLNGSKRHAKPGDYGGCSGHYGHGVSTHASPTSTRAALQVGCEVGTERMLSQPKRSLHLSPRLPFNFGYGADLTW